MRFTIITLFIFLSTIISAQTNYYVETAGSGGNDANDGLTPGAPKATIQSVLTNYDLDPNDVINIGAGTYNEDNIRSNGDDNGFTFQGAGESSTIINGDGTDQIFDFTDCLDGTGNCDDVVWRDMTIQNGNGDGGGIHADGQRGFDLYNVTVDDCDGGVSVHLGDWNLSPTGLSILDNVTISNGDGGAILIHYNDLTITNSDIHDNDGTNGVVYTYTVSRDVQVINITSSNFYNNSTTNGTIYLDHGANPAHPESVQIVDCEFYDNTATSQGGALWIDAFTGSPSTTNTDFDVIRCKFYGNQASQGSAIYADGGGGEQTYTNCLFYENRATGNPGGVFYGSGSNRLFMNCTFADNSHNGSNYGGVVSDFSFMEFSNCILYGNEREDIYDDDGFISRVRLTNSMVQNIDHGDIDYNNGSVAGPPAFSDDVNDDYSLSALSPAIDAGAATDTEGNSAPANDIDANARTAAPDVGAYEGSGAPAGPTNGPGGVTVNLGLWLDATTGVEEAGADPAADTESVLNWLDQSGSSNDFTQATPANKPTFRDNSSDNINFNPIVEFDGTNDVMEDASGILGGSTYSDVNVYFVGKTNTVQNSWLFREGVLPTPANTRFGVHLPYGNGNIAWDAGSSVGDFRLSRTWAENTDQSYLWSFLYSTTTGQTVAAANQVISLDGEVVANDASASSFTGASQAMQIGNRSVEPMHGDFAEFIIYRGAISAADHNNIESYLAIKYGITLDNSGGSTDGDYTDASSTVLWDADANATYHNDVFGIGRDDNSTLDQKISASQNNDNILTIAVDPNFTSMNSDGGRTSLDDDEFLIVGNNNGAASWTATGAPSGFGLLSRQWITSEIGTIAAVNLQFNVGDSDFDVPALLDGTVYYFVRDTDADGDLSDETPAALTNSSGNLWTIAVDLADGAIFSLATEAAIPVITAIDDTTVCDSFTLPAIAGTNLSGSQAYYTATNGGGTQYNVGDPFTTTGTTILYAYDVNGIGQSDEEFFNVTIQTTPTLDAIDDTTLCDSYTLPPITGTNIAGTPAYFTQNDGSGTRYAVGDPFTTVGTTTLYAIDSTAGGCLAFEEFDITIQTTPTLDAIDDTTLCDSYTLPPITGTNIAGTPAYFTQNDGSGTRYAVGDPFTTVGTTTLYAIDSTAGGCLAFEEFDITIQTTPTLDAIDDTTLCDSYTLPPITGTNIAGTPAYFTQNDGSGTRYAVGDPFTTVGTTTLYAIDSTAGGCLAFEEFDITIQTTPTLDAIDDTVACDTYTFPPITGTNIAGTPAYFTQNDGGGTRYAVGDPFTTLGTTTLYAIDSTAGGCLVFEDFEITIQTTPTLDPIGPVVECDSYTLPAIDGTNLSGNQAYFTQNDGGGTRYAIGDSYTVAGTNTLFAIDSTAGGCLVFEQFDITINLTPVLDGLSDTIACGVDYTVNVANITGTNLSGSQGFYTAPGGVGPIPNLISYSAPTDFPIYIYDENGTCTSGDSTFRLWIKEIPSISFTSNPIEHCENTEQQLDVTVTGGNPRPAGPEYDYVWSGSTGIIGAGDVNTEDPTIQASATPGGYTLTLEVTDDEGCEESNTVNVTINPSPLIAIGNDGPICEGETINLQETGGEATSWIWTSINGIANIVDENDQTTDVTGAVDGEIFQVRIGDGNGCLDSLTTTVTVVPQPDLNVFQDSLVCDSLLLPSFVGAGTNLTSNIAYYDAEDAGGNKFLPGEYFTTAGRVYIYDSTTAAPFCMDSTSFLLTIDNSPIIDPIAPMNYCDSILLPAIAGTGLSGLQAYYTGTEASGTKYEVGDYYYVTGASTLYAFDSTANGCFDEVAISMNDVDNPVLSITTFTAPSVCGAADASLQLAHSSASGQSDAGTLSWTGSASGTNPGAVVNTDVLDVSGLTAGTYTVVFTDALGCQSDPVIQSINDPGAPIIDATGWDTTACNIPFTMPDPTTIDGTNLVAANFYSQPDGLGVVISAGTVFTAPIDTVIYMYDSNGACEANESFRIQIFEEPTVNITPNPVLHCFGSETELNGNPAIGQIPFSHFWRGDTTIINDTTIVNPTIQADAPIGAYNLTYTVIDNQGCTATTGVSVTVNDKPTASISSESPICEGASIDLDENSGVIYTTYEWTSDAASIITNDNTANANATGATDGEIFQLVVSNALGCTDTVITMVTVVPQPDIDAITPIAICDSVELAPFSGSQLTGNIAYYSEADAEGNKFNPGDWISTSGTYYAYDSTSVLPHCFDEVSFSVTIEESPIIDEIPDIEECAEAILPAISGTLTGNQAYYSGSMGTGTQYLAGDAITVSGTYYIYDATLTAPVCWDEDTIEITINPLPTITTNTNNPTTCDGNDGEIDVQYTGLGSSTGIVEWTGNSSGINPSTDINLSATDITGLDAGSYNVFFVDENNCRSLASTVTLNSPLDPILDPVVPYTACNVPLTINENDLDATTINPVDPAYYTAPGGPTGGGTRIGTRTFTAPTNTTIWVYDANGSCESETSFQVTIYENPEIVPTLSDVEICERSSIEIIGGANTGEAPFTHAWSSGGPTLTSSIIDFDDRENVSVLNTLTPGLYPLNYQVTDNNGCSANTSINVEVLASPAASITPNPVSQFCSSDSIQLTEQNVGMDSWEWTIYGDATIRPVDAENPYVSNASNGDIAKVVITNLDGCKDSTTVTLNVLESPVISEIGNIDACDELNLPSISITNGSGNEAFYNMSMGAGSTFSEGETITLSGTYYAYDEVTDITTCFDEDTFEVSITVTPIIDALIDTSVCSEFELEDITGALSGNEGYFTESLGNGSTFDAEDLITETISIYAYDFATVNPACFDEDTLFIEVVGQPVIDHLIDTIVCDTLILPEITGNLSGNEMYFTLPQGDGDSYLPGDAYTSSGTLYIYDELSDACWDEDTINVTVNISPIVEIISNIEGEPSYPLYSNLEAEAEDYDVLEWLIDDVSSSDTTFLRKKFDQGGYNVVLVGSDTITGCLDSASIYLDLFNQNLDSIVFPNVITPGVDQINDILRFDIDFIEVDFSVYNRWGVLIYQSNNTKAGWDGRTIVGGEAAEGVYYYIIKGTLINGDPFVINNSLTLIRED